MAVIAFVGDKMYRAREKRAVGLMLGMKTCKSLIYPDQYALIQGDRDRKEISLDLIVTGGAIDRYEMSRLRRTVGAKGILHLTLDAPKDTCVIDEFVAIVTLTKASRGTLYRDTFLHNAQSRRNRVSKRWHRVLALGAE